MFIVWSNRVREGETQYLERGTGVTLVFFCFNINKHKPYHIIMILFNNMFC